MKSRERNLIGKLILVIVLTFISAVSQADSTVTQSINTNACSSFLGDGVWDTESSMCLAASVASCSAIEKDYDAVTNRCTEKALDSNYKISVGDYHNCVIDDNGVSCWGGGNGGELTYVPSLSNPIHISVGFGYTCAIDDSGVVCWEYESFITNDVIDDSGQTNIPDLSNPTLVSSGYKHACALDDTGVVCWGDNAAGQTNVPSLLNPIQVSSGSSHTCALDDSGVVCWGDNDLGQTNVPSLKNPTQVSSGMYHTCALDETGVVCWGDNIAGQTNVPNLLNPTQVSSGSNHACALDDYGVVCWGEELNYSYFPNSPYTNGNTYVPNLINPTLVSSGNYHTCALDDTGVVCWGATDASIPSKLSFCSEITSSRYSVKHRSLYIPYVSYNNSNYIFEYSYTGLDSNGNLKWHKSHETEVSENIPRACEPTVRLDSDDDFQLSHVVAVQKNRFSNTYYKASLSSDMDYFFGPTLTLDSYQQIYSLGTSTK